jgi:hypothetical protein
MGIGEHQKLTTGFLASIKHVSEVRHGPPLNASLPPSQSPAHGGYAVGRSKAENMAAALKPASPTVPTAAPDKQYYDDDDQKSCGVHTVLLIADGRDRSRAIPKIKKGHPGPRGRQLRRANPSLPSERSAFFRDCRPDRRKQSRQAARMTLPM